MEAYVALFGMNDQNITLVEQECGVAVSLQGNALGGKAGTGSHCLFAEIRDLTYRQFSYRAGRIRDSCADCLCGQSGVCFYNGVL